jgi:hypothetical protein
VCKTFIPKKIRRKQTLPEGDALYNALLKKDFTSYTRWEKDMNTLCSLFWRLVDYWFIAFNGEHSTFTSQTSELLLLTMTAREELMECVAPVLNATKGFVTKRPYQRFAEKSQLRSNSQRWRKKIYQLHYLTLISLRVYPSIWLPLPIPARNTKLVRKQITLRKNKIDLDQRVFLVGKRRNENAYQYITDNLSLSR